MLIKLCLSAMVTFLIFFSSLSLNAAEIRIIKGDNLMIKGEIEKGDYKKLINVILKYGKIPGGIAITSPGGDVIEAMKIGRFARKNHLLVFALPPCDSACAFIVFAAVKRMGNEVGLHRPYYNHEYFAKLSGQEANTKYKELDTEVRNYLTEMNVPTITIDKIMSISSTDIERLELSSYDKLAGKSPPAYYEWLSARCGAFDENEREYYKNVATLVGSQEHPDVVLDSDSFIGKLAQYQIVEALKLPAGYRNYLYKKGTKIIECEEKAIEDERRKNYKKLSL